MEPLVLIHGFSGIPAMWEPMLPALQERFDVRPLGLAGHFGCSPFSEGAEIGAKSLFDALERDMDEAGFETAHICGNSLGGWAALELANRGRARSCVPISPAGGWEAGSKEEKRLTPAVQAPPRDVEVGEQAPRAALPAPADAQVRLPRRRRARRAHDAAPGGRHPAGLGRVPDLLGPLRIAAQRRAARRTSTASTARRRSSGAPRTGSCRSRATRSGSGGSCRRPSSSCSRAPATRR